MSRKPKEIYIPFNSSYHCPLLQGFGKQALGEALNSHAKINYLQIPESGKKLKNYHILWEVERGVQPWQIAPVQIQCLCSLGPQPWR